MKMRVNVRVDPATGMPARNGTGVVTGVYEGGAYVDLSFNGSKPAEVINLRSGHTGLLDDRAETSKGLREIVTAWCVDKASDWPEYFTEYVKNANI